MFFTLQSHHLYKSYDSSRAAKELLPIYDKVSMSYKYLIPPKGQV